MGELHGPCIGHVVYRKGVGDAILREFGRLERGNVISYSLLRTELQVACGVEKLVFLFGHGI